MTLLTIAFLDWPGTGDVGIWLTWGERVDAMGMRAALAANGY